MLSKLLQKWNVVFQITMSSLFDREDDCDACVLKKKVRHDVGIVFLKLVSRPTHERVVISHLSTLNTSLIAANNK